MAVAKNKQTRRVNWTSREMSVLMPCDGGDPGVGGP